MITGIIVISVFLGLLVLDIFLPGMGQPTESQWLRDAAWKWNTIPFIAGFLLGHWFFSRYTVKYSAWGYALGVLIAELLTDGVIRLWFPDSYPWWRYPGWHALLGIPVGMYLWGQSHERSQF